MSANLRPLCERYPGVYPAWAPQWEADLVEMEHDDIVALCTERGASDADQAIVLEQRRGTLDAVMAHTRMPIHSPEHCLTLLENRKLSTQARKWTTYVLGADRVRPLVPHPDGGLHYLRVTTKRVPKAEHLAQSAPLPRGGVYLVVYGGGPSILSAVDSSGVGVADDIAELMASAPVADVLFWHLEQATPPTLYSLGVGAGDRGGERVEFPDHNALARARTSQKELL